MVHRSGGARADWGDGLPGTSSAMLHGPLRPTSHRSTRPTSMWPSLERTRRLLRRDAGSTPTDHPVAVAADASPIDDVVIAMGRTELERLGAALQSLLGPATSRPDTPVRLQAALSAAIARYGGSESRVR